MPPVKDSISADLRDLPPLQQAAAWAAERETHIGEVLRDWASTSGLELVTEFTIDEDQLKGIPRRLWVELGCLPIALENPGAATLPLVSGTLPQPSADRWLMASTGKVPDWRLADPREIEKILIDRFGVGSLSLDDDGSSVEEEVDLDEDLDEEAAVVKFVNEIIDRALQSRATDIHFEPYRDQIRIRYRIDGVLVPISVPDNLARFHASIISRIKILARLNISEKRRPQDGRIAHRNRGRDIDIRLSTFPTIHGESISLRLLDQANQVLTIEQLGVPPRDQKLIERTVRLPFGILLVTGPTGSGKSTSLNAFLRLINSEERRIMTVEDPVEYEVPGINQTQVREEVGLTFASALRHILRQDPDVIMIGEIRDQDTADIAVRAALTGHFVFSTLHTNDAAGALARLVDMGVEPFLIASAVELIIAQRLVRRLCPHCLTPTPPNPTHLRRFERLLETPLTEVQSVFHSPGCDQCRGIGYQGRVGLFEMLTVTESIHDLILKNASARAIRDAARGDGMKTMAQCALEHILKGATSMEECLRVLETLSIPEE